MSRICFVSYEIHPTTWGGCGVLLHHAAELLLQQGHEVIFLLDIPAHEFERFNNVDRLAFSNSILCRGYLVDALCEGFPFEPDAIPSFDQYKSLRFAYAFDQLSKQETIDYVEFFEYCGSGYYALAQKLYGFGPQQTIVGQRIHNSLELIDKFQASNALDRNRYLLYALEQGAMDLAESVLIPTETYYKEYYQGLYRLPRERVAASQSPKLAFPAVKRRPDKTSGRIAYFGRIFQFKGVDQFVNAAILLLKKRPDIQCSFELIGYDSNLSPTGGSYIDYLKNKVPRAWRDRFNFTGHLPHEKVAERLNDTLFAVFPNLFESFCYAVHEIYDAGVPVVVNDLPGWSDFFKHERNALVYDGSTKALLHAMERMHDDDALRQRLTKPYPIADKPLGTYYDHPTVLTPLRSGPEKGATPRALVLITHESERDAEETTLSSLQYQTCGNFDVIRLYKTTDAGEETFRWQGAFWRARNRQGKVIMPLEIETAQALLILKNGDKLDRRWLELCLEALRARPNMAFAGTWASVAGKFLPATLDLAPECYPVWFGSRPTRALLRTEPGTLLLDLFDTNLDALGEIGYIWQAITRWGRGCLLPMPLLELADNEYPTVEDRKFSYLINRYGGPFASRLALLINSLLVQSHQAAPLPPAAQAPAAPAAPSLVYDEQVLRSYMENKLNMRDLLHLAVRRVKRRFKKDLGMPQQ